MTDMNDKQFGRLVGRVLNRLDWDIDRLRQQRKAIVEIAEHKNASANDKMFNLHAQMMRSALIAKWIKIDLNRVWNAITEIIGWDIRDERTYMK